ncbi:MAG: hypothetical protein KDJ65_11655 [Anaerolineae bacterium]|nr:hypothetical protein [Anaerolineae bacterium]
MHLFTEIFPATIENLPKLNAYQLTLIGSLSANEIGGKLKYRLQNKFDGYWYWDSEQECLLANLLISQEQIDQTLKDLWAETDRTFQQNLEGISHTPDLSPSTSGIAKFVAHALLQAVENKIEAKLTTHRQDKGTYYINLICTRFGWVVNGLPAVSLSIRSNIDFKDDLKAFMTKRPNDNIVGLFATDKTKPFNTAMEITKIVGEIGEHNRRTRLLTYDLNPEMRELVANAPDGELVIETNGRYQYVVSALGLRVLNKHYERFGISEKLQISSARRKDYVLPVAKIAQKTGFIGTAYNSNSNADLFLDKTDIGYSTELRFGNGQSASPRSFKDVFPLVLRHGLYNPINDKKIKIAILNTKPQVKLDPLKTNLRKILGDNLGYELTTTETGLINVPKPTPANIERAVNQLGEQQPNIILGIIPQEYGSGDDESDNWTTYDYFKYYTLNKNLQSQVIQPSTIRNDWAVNNIILGILAKTGNIPFVLANSITYADLIVGLDVSRRKKKNNPGSINTAAIAKIYLTNGQFLHYNIRDATVEGETIPRNVLQAIFPVETFQNKRVVIHRDGNLQESEKVDLLAWGKEIGAEFFFVEVIKSGNPRIYAQHGKETRKAPKGSIFKLSDTEALMVSSEYPDSFEATPQPIRVRVHPPFTLTQALHSVLSLTLLHYGSIRPPRLPVTTFYADKISKMASKGIRPAALDGNIPFWI